MLRSNALNVPYFTRISSNYGPLYKSVTGKLGKCMHEFSYITYRFGVDLQTLLETRQFCNCVALRLVIDWNFLLACHPFDVQRWNVFRVVFHWPSEVVKRRFIALFIEFMKSVSGKKRLVFKRCLCFTEKDVFSPNQIRQFGEIE